MRDGVRMAVMMDMIVIVAVVVFVMRFVVMTAARAQRVEWFVFVTHGGHRSASRSVSCNSATARFVRPSFTASMMQCSR